MLRWKRLKEVLLGVISVIIVSIIVTGCSKTELDFIEELINQPVEMLDETAFQAESKKDCIPILLIWKW